MTRWQEAWRQAQTKTRWQIATDRVPRWYRFLVRIERALQERAARRLP